MCCTILVCVCVQGEQHRGSAAYQSRTSLVRHAALYSPIPEWLQGYTKTIGKTKDLNCPWYMSTAQPTMGATTAGTSTKCQGKLLNNKSIQMLPMSLSVGFQKLLAMLQLHLAQPAVFTAVVAPPAYKVLPDASLNLV